MRRPAIFGEDECEAISRRLLSMIGKGEAQVSIWSVARTSTEVARGDVHVSAELQRNIVELAVDIGGRRASVETDRVDDTGLRALVTSANELSQQNRSRSPWNFQAAQAFPRGPTIFFDSTLEAMDAEAQSAIFRRATDATASAGLIAAGDLTVEAVARWALGTRGLRAYERQTFGEFSLTARTADGRGSGWGWSGFEDWSRVQVDAVIGRAVDLAQRSANPVAVEPGRYEVILEPAAVAALLEPLFYEWDARAADAGSSVFAKEPRGTNKIGLQMLDRRLGMVSDPWDPERPGSTITGMWTPIPGPVRWFEEGVLTNLAYDPVYARAKGRSPVVDPGGLRLTVAGERSTLEDMIAATRRGLWVNRLSHVFVMNGKTLLLSGTTRDGTFLIENGKITKAIKNFRFTESPFFVFNKLEAAGEPVRASRAVVAPRLKLRDFDFTSLTDAI